jgi:hypothetical protein
MVTVFHRFGKPSTHSGRVLTPRTRAMLLRFPGLRGGFVWNRPAGVLVDENGERVAVDTPDVTRRIQWTLLGLGAAAAVAIAVRARRRRPRGVAAALRRLPRLLRA